MAVRFLPPQKKKSEPALYRPLLLFWISNPDSGLDKVTYYDRLCVIWRRYEMFGGIFVRHFSGRGRVRRIVIACITHDDNNTTMCGVVNKRTAKTRTAYDSAAGTYIIIFPDNEGLSACTFTARADRHTDAIPIWSDRGRQRSRRLSQRYHHVTGCFVRTYLSLKYIFKYIFRSQVSYGICVQRENI